MIDHHHNAIKQPTSPSSTDRHAGHHHPSRLNAAQKEPHRPLARAASSTHQLSSKIHHLQGPCRELQRGAWFHATRSRVATANNAVIYIDLWRWQLAPILKHMCHIRGNLTGAERGVPRLCISPSRSQCASTSKSCDCVSPRSVESKAMNAADTHLLVVMQALDIIFSHKLTLRRLLRALVLHALGEILGIIGSGKNKTDGNNKKINMHTHKPKRIAAALWSDNTKSRCHGCREERIGQRGAHRCGGGNC